MGIETTPALASYIAVTWILRLSAFNFVQDLAKRSDKRALRAACLATARPESLDGSTETGGGMWTLRMLKRPGSDGVGETRTLESGGILSAGR